MSEPTLDEQIEYLNQFYKCGTIDAIKASLERLKLLDAQEPVEPDRVKEMRSPTWCGGDVSDVLQYIDTLQSDLQRATEERDAATELAVSEHRRREVSESYAIYERERAEAAESLNKRLVELLRDDKYASGFQSLAQYRTALLKEVK